MGTYEELKAAIQQVIRTNGNNEITGALLQNALLSIVNVVGANATFAGIATPNTNPGTADQNVFYLATEAGTYVKFGGIEINMGEAVILSNKTGNWVKTTSGFATQQQLTELESNLDKNIANQNNEIAEFKEAITDQVDNYKPIVINGNVTNAADEEDITSEDNLLKLKNRSALNGMGYVILRKNQSFVTQVTKPNTIYEIRYDFNLQGDSFEIPENCILKFVGGKLINGNIVGNETAIDAPMSQIFDGVLVSGTMNVAEAFPEWFGATGDGITDDTLAIQQCIDSFYRIFFSYKTYICSCRNNVGLKVDSSKILCGNQWSKYEEYNNEHSIKFKNVTENDVCLWVRTNQVKLENIQLKADGDTKKGIGILHSKDNGGVIFGLTADHVRVIGFGTGMELKSFLNVFTKVYLSACDWGMKIRAGIDAYPTSNSLTDCYFDSNNNGLQVEGVYHSLINCAFDVTAGTALHVMKTCDRLLCIRGSFESNRQAINNEGGYSKFINCYFLDNTDIWSSPEEAANYLRFFGDCGVMDNLHIRINDAKNPNVPLDSNFKCIYAVNNYDFHPSLIIDGYFDAFGYIKSDNTLNCIIKDPLWNNYRGHSALTDRLTDQFRAEFYDPEIKKPLWWDGAKWRDAMGNDVDNMPYEKIIDVGNKDASYWDSIRGKSYSGRIITGYHLGMNTGITTIGCSSYTLQIANGYNTGVLKTRTFYTDGGYWTEWKTISTENNS